MTFSRMLPILLSSLLAWGQSPKSAASTPAIPARLRIAVDAGHGGDDNGAKGPAKLKLVEKDIALALALVLEEELRQEGFDVVLTRSDDTFVPLWDRAKMANEAGADLFLSLHLNASRARRAKGSEVYFLSLDAGDKDAADVAALENGNAAKAAPTPDSLVASILDDLAQKAYLQDSERLAVGIQDQLNRLGGIKERGVKQAPFVVLRGAAMPAVLVETAFISNPKEALKLQDAAFRKKVARTIAIGVRSYFTGARATSRRKAIAPAG
ncbi:MAG TPA: N-acetylmuramoyl-L-alanine amidase [Holophaga sp.]|nr:N-acetylmuramoyl-L-alanine amidase [Holophaga sp.]